jgi:hypothetical protein
MIWGFSAADYTIVHVVISLIGIASGFMVLTGTVLGYRLNVWTAVFFVFTIATSVTGFGFPAEKTTPSHIVGLISLAVLALALLARYFFKLSERWMFIYLLSAASAQWLNCFVLVVQLFLKVPALKELAPTQSESPFVAAQGLLLVLMIVLTLLALKRVRTSSLV